MEKAKEILEIIRGATRPYLTISGWTTGLVLAILLTIKFANREIALMIIGPIIGAIISIVNFWFGGRQVKKE